MYLREELYFSFTANCDFFKTKINLDLAFYFGNNFKFFSSVTKILMVN